MAIFAVNPASKKIVSSKWKAKKGGTLETALSSLAAAGTRREEVTRAEPRSFGAAAEFEAVVRQHQRRIYRLLYALVRDRDAAETLTQECFLRAWEKRASFREESSVGTWLVRIAVNLARDHAKNRRRAFWTRLLRWAKNEDPMEHAAARVAAPATSPERAVVVREQADAVWAVVEELAPQQRAIFTLRFAEEMTLEEIAAALGLQVGTVKAHLHRALGAVRRKLRKQATEAQRHREEQGL